MGEPDHAALEKRYNEATRRLAAFSIMLEGYQKLHTASLEIGEPRDIDNAHHAIMNTMEVILDLQETQYRIVLQGRGIDPTRRHLEDG